MRVIILGASRFGAAVAERMSDAGHEVVVIDKDRARLEKLAERMDCGMIEGDGTMPTVLREAFRDEDDVFVAVTNASDDNILASIVARSVGFGRVIPQITATELLDICQELGLDDVINPHATVAESICAALEDRTAVDQETVLHNDLSLLRVQVPKTLAGSTFGELELPDNCRVVALVRDEAESFVASDTRLQHEDCLIFAVTHDKADSLRSVFAED
ncbi:MAG: potassium channel family protein [Paracoccaceae bacterium]